MSKAIVTELVPRSVEVWTPEHDEPHDHVCECPTAPEGHVFGADPKCEHFDHHCEGCHSYSHMCCTKAECVREFGRSDDPRYHHCGYCHPKLHLCTHPLCKVDFALGNTASDDDRT